MILQNTITKNNQSSQDILEKIENILEKKFGSQKENIDTSLYVRGVDLMLKKPDSKETSEYISLYLLDLGKDFYNLLPEPIKKAREVQLLALRLGIINFSDLPKKMQSEREFLFLYIDTLRKNLSLPYLLALVSQDKILRNQKKIFMQYFSDSENLMGFSDLEGLYIHLYFEYPKILNILSEKHVFSESSINFGLHPEFEKFLLSDMDSFSPEEISEKLAEKIFSYVGLSQKELPENFISTFLACIIAKLKTKNKNTKQKEKEDENKDDISEDSLDENFQEENPSPVRNSGSYVYYESPNYPNSHVELTREEYENANEKSLENFIKFSQILKRLDLDFLIGAKHRNKIQIATGIHFLADIGMNEAKIFLFLSRLGKHIGVPESSYEDEDGNKKVSEFQTLAEAIFVFSNIRSSGFVAGEKICDVSKKGDNSIVELALKYKGKIGGSYDEILLSNWK